MKPSASTRNTSRAYYSAFVLVVLVSFSPFKPLAYTLPFISIFWLYCCSRNAELKRRVLLMVLAVTALITLYYILETNYLPVGGMVAAVTYGSLIVVAVVPAKYVADKVLLERVQLLLKKVILFEACFGILQGLVAAYRSGSFDIANGDAVEGTIHLGFGPDEAFGNPMFAANICFLLLALLPSIVKRKSSVYLPFSLGVIAFVMASVMHMIIFFVISVIVALCIFKPPFPAVVGKRRLILVSLLIPVLTLGLLSGNLGSLPSIISGFISGELPKGEMVRRAIFEMPTEYPSMPFVGLGAGQFSSRASLITTGLYFGGLEEPKNLPFLKGETSKPVDDYLYDLWVLASDFDQFGGGSSAKPFFSWLSVCTEFGAPVLIGAFIYVIVLLNRLRVKAQSADQKWLAVSIGAGIMFFLSLGVQENYWEVPQAILVGLMWLLVAYANVVHGSSTQPAKNSNAEWAS